MDGQGATPERRGDLAALGQRPPPVLPRTDDEWRQLALDVRASRTLAPIGAGRVFTGGSIVLTEITPRGVMQGVLGAFDDREDGEEFARAVAGTLHPVSLAAPCHSCDSGKRWIDCCLAPHLGEPCRGCDSGKPLGQCCAVIPGPAATPTAPAQVALASA